MAIAIIECLNLSLTYLSSPGVMIVLDLFKNMNTVHYYNDIFGNGTSLIEMLSTSEVSIVINGSDRGSVVWKPHCFESVNLKTNSSVYGALWHDQNGSGNLYSHFGPHDYLSEVVIRTATSAAEYVEGVPSATGIMQGSMAAESTVRDMQFMHNFKISHRLLSDEEANIWKPGYFEQGVGRLLNNGETDIAIGYYTMTSNRVPVASPLLPIISEPVYAHYIQQEPQILSGVLYLYPFTPSALGGIAILIFLSSFAIVVALPHDVGTHLILDVAFLAVSIISRQAINEAILCGRRWHLPFALKCVLVIGALFSLMIVTIYGGQLLVALKIPAMMFQGIEPLYQSGYKFHTSSSLQEQLFTNKSQYLEIYPTADDVLDLWYAKRISYVGFPVNSINSGWLSMKMRKHLAWMKNPDPFICKTLHSVKVMNSKSFSFFVKKHSPIRGILNVSILKIHQSGLLQRSFKYTVADRLDCPTPQVYVENLSLSDISSAFIFLLTVSLAAVFVFCVEVVRLGRACVCK